ncbi:MAG TPA: amino acid permease [Cyclobacteriaceae bacterium]|nr:amino acid permease [Cyclobacteriaceae bacterium]
MGFWASTAFAIGNMIGSGIFLLPASLAFYGGIGMVGWLCSAVGAMLLALMFGSLSKYGSTTIGGPYVYTRMGLGDFAAYLVAWGYWIAIWATNAAIAIALVGYLSVFIPALRINNVIAMFTGLGFIWLFTWINSKPLKMVAAVQMITTVLKVVPILSIGLFGIAYIEWEHFTPFNLSGSNNWLAITATTTLTTFAFQGMESAGVISGETSDAARTVRKATIVGTIVTIIVYVTSSLAIMGIIPSAELMQSGAPFADAAEAFWGPAARYIVAGCAVMATMGALNGWILMQGRIPMAAAQDKLFPKIFGKVNQHQSPISGIVISSLLASALMALNFSKSLTEMFNFIILLSTLTMLIPYLFSAASLAIIEFNEGGKANHRNVWIAMLAFVFCLWVVIGCGAEVVFYGFILMMASIPFYALLKKQSPTKQSL